jgi:protein gp37
MQKSKIEWCKYTWNPVTGCLHRCGDFCYAKRQANRLKGRFGYPAEDPFRPTFHPKRIGEPLKVKKPSKIFADSMSDLFGDWVSYDWINAVLNTVDEAYWHTFQFLTQNPKRYLEFEFPKNAWLGYTSRVADFRYANIIKERHPNNIVFVSAEPLHGLKLPLQGNPDWIIMGLETGNRKNKVIPERAWYKAIEEYASAYRIPLFVKNNAGGWRQEYPQ